MLEGSLNEGVHRLTVRVYYEDTDFSGFVYHSNYLKFCERARSDFLRVIGIDQKSMFAAGQAFVVRKMVCDFLRPANFDDVLEIVTSPLQMKGARFELRQQVFRGDVLLFSAEVTVAVVGPDGRPKRMPAELAHRLRINHL